ncbi:hypothetical protein pb186bvf_006643 [Paramecium bursaria]
MFAWSPQLFMEMILKNPQYASIQTSDVIRYLQTLQMQFQGSGFVYHDFQAQNPEPQIQRPPVEQKRSQKKKCQNQFCDKTTEECTIVKKDQKQYIFCILCYQNYKDNYFCEYCIQIYDPIEGEEVDEKEWIMCEMCSRWNHIDCEEQYGINNIKKIKKQTDYYCRECRLKPPEERIVIPKVQQKKQVPKSEPITMFKDNQRILSVSLKLTDDEIQQDLELLRIGQESTPTGYRKTIRRKRQKI